MGVGGHIEEGESPDLALVREVKEETNLDLLSYSLRGLIYFQNDDYQEIMYLYTSDNYKGEIGECNEGELYFIPKEKVLTLNIWEGDKIFLKYLKDNEPFFKLKLTYKDKKLVEAKRLSN